MRLIQQLAVDRSLIAKLSHRLSDSSCLLGNMKRAVLENRWQFRLSNFIGLGCRKILERRVRVPQKIKRFAALHLAMVELRVSKGAWTGRIENQDRRRERHLLEFHRVAIDVK